MNGEHTTGPKLVQRHGQDQNQLELNQSIEELFKLIDNKVIRSLPRDHKE